MDRDAFTDGYTRIEIKIPFTGGDPGRTSFDFVPNADGSPTKGVAYVGAVRGSSVTIVYFPPSTLDRADEVSYVAKQGAYTSSPAAIYILNGGVVSVVVSPPGPALQAGSDKILPAPTGYM